MADRANNAESNPDMQKTLGHLILAVYIIGALALGAYVVHFAFVHHLRISSDPGDWGTLGDYFGGLLNPVVSFATLVVAYAVWKQQKEELKATKEALEEQAKTAEQQRQEQRFFDLLRVYNQTLDSYTSADAFNRRELRGKEAISEALNRSRQYLKETLKLGFGQTLENEELTPEYVSSRLKAERHLQRFNAYMRVVFRLLEEAEPLLGGQHQRYISLFQSQLSDDEVRLIGLLSWMDPRWSSQIALLEKYCLLKHFPEGPFRSDLANLIGSRSFSEEGATPC